MTNEQPEQWVVELWQQAFNAHAQSGPLLPSVCAALTIQRAFAEREAELVGENAKLRVALANLANRINIIGSPYHQAMEALDAIVQDTKRAARAALKSREAGHG